MNSSPQTTTSNIFLKITYWASALAVAVCVVSAVMSLALYEGGERFEGAAYWGVGAVVCLIVNRFVRRRGA